MRDRTSSRVSILAAVVVGVGLPARTAAAQATEPITYTVRVPAPEEHVAEIVAVVPTGGRPSLELMMPIWTPGFYRVEDHARRIQALSARRPDGAALAVEQTRKDRWRIETGGGPTVVVSYRLSCEGRSVTTNWVGDNLA